MCGSLMSPILTWPILMIQNTLKIALFPKTLQNMVTFVHAWVARKKNVTFFESRFIS